MCTLCGDVLSVCSPHRQHLLVHTARSAGYSKLMLGDSCTRLAVKLLSSISLGRGAQLAHDTVRPPSSFILGFHILGVKSDKNK